MGKQGRVEIASCVYDAATRSGDELGLRALILLLIALSPSHFHEGASQI
jgi:hypothetical protein